MANRSSWRGCRWSQPWVGSGPPGSPSRTSSTVRIWVPEVLNELSGRGLISPSAAATSSRNSRVARSVCQVMYSGITATSVPSSAMKPRACITWSMALANGGFITTRR